MARPTKTDQELGYVRDYWTEIRTIEAEYQGVVELRVWGTPRPGVLSGQIVFTPFMGEVPNLIGTQSITFTYPNAERSTFAGFLWRKAISLGRMIGEARQIVMPAPHNGG